MNGLIKKTALLFAMGGSALTQNACKNNPSVQHADLCADYGAEAARRADFLELHKVVKNADGTQSGVFLVSSESKPAYSLQVKVENANDTPSALPAGIPTCRVDERDMDRWIATFNNEYNGAFAKTLDAAKTAPDYEVLQRIERRLGMGRAHLRSAKNFMAAQRDEASLHRANPDDIPAP